MEFTIDHPTLFRGFRPDDIQTLSFNCPDLREAEEFDAQSFNAAMAYVASLSDLRDMIFDRMPINADGLANLKLNKMQKLNSLDFKWCPFLDGKDLGNSCTQPFFREFVYSHAKNASGLLKVLHDRKTKIESLEVSGDGLTDDDLKVIGDMEIENLNISKNDSLTAKGLTYALKNKKLSRLIIDEKQFERDPDHSLLKALVKATALRFLVINDIDWTKEQREKLKKSLPQCEVIYVPNS